jgi:ABC-type transport system substrate-binding protein
MIEGYTCWPQDSHVGRRRDLSPRDVKFTYDRFLTEKGNPVRYLLDSVHRVEVVDRSSVRFRLKEPYVWLLDVLARPQSMWIIAPEVVQQFGDLKKPETAIGTGPFLLERYKPNVKTVFTRNPDYFRQGQPSCVPGLQHAHRLLATVRQELCAQPQLRLRQSRCGVVAGPRGVE